MEEKKEKKKKSKANKNLSKVFIKFCGSCNPHIDTGKIAVRLKKILPEMGWAPAFSSFTEDCQALIILSGCPVDCADRPSQTKKTVVVAGSHVNLEKWEYGYIPERVCQLLGEESSTL